MRQMQVDPQESELFAARMAAAAAIAGRDAARSLTSLDVNESLLTEEPPATLKAVLSTRTERRLQAQLAAHQSWAHTDDRSARTAKAREAFDRRFEHEVDPDGVLSPVERARRADHARKAYFTRLALKSAQVRRKSRSG